MSEKTEAPSRKRIEDAAKKGQVVRFTELLHVSALLGVGALVLSGLGTGAVVALLERTLSLQGLAPPAGAATHAAQVFAGYVTPVIVLSILIVVLPTLVANRFRMAPEAMKLNFGKLDPVAGIKKIFSVKTLKDAVKSLLFVGAFTLGTISFMSNHTVELYQLAHGDVQRLAPAAAGLLVRLGLACVIASIAIVVLDTLAEYLLHIKQLRMSRHEVKQEYKEAEGDPHVKSRRKELADELLSEQVKSDVRGSTFVLANPTHIALGIYINPDISALPFVSVRETEARARAVIAYAKSINVPVVRDVKLARALFASARRYSFVGRQWIESILQVLDWLIEVERAQHGAPAAASDAAATPAVEPATAVGEPATLGAEPATRVAEPAMPAAIVPGATPAPDEPQRATDARAP